MQLQQQHSDYDHLCLSLSHADDRSFRDHSSAELDHLGGSDHHDHRNHDCRRLPDAGSGEFALGGSYTGPISTPSRGGGIVCVYRAGTGTAVAAIYAHQSPAVFAGQVAHAPGNPAMPSISGVGDGAYGMTTGGRSIVNAYSNATRTLVAAQASGAIAPVEALAKVALADN